jgi:predicted transcriptional regulator
MKDKRQADLFTELPYGGHPGYRDTDTSKDAARLAGRTMGELHRIVMNTIAASGPLAADEIAHMIGRTFMSVRPRVTELVHAGYLYDTGKRRKSVFGNRQIVVDLTNKARAERMRA